MHSRTMSMQGANVFYIGSSFIISMTYFQTPPGMSSDVDSKEMLKNFVHTLTEIGYDNTINDLLMYYPFDGLPTLNFQLDDDGKQSTGSKHASPTRSSTEIRVLIEEQNLDCFLAV